VSDSIERRFVILGLSSFAGAIVLGCTEPPKAPPPRVKPTPQIHETELAMFKLLNRDRAANGKPALQYDESLADVARAHADDMRKNKYFAHDSPTWGTLDDRLARAQISVATARENLAEAMDVEEAERTLVASPGHFANIVADDVTHVGVGVVAGGVAHPEMLLFVQVYAKPVVQESPSRAKEVVLARITEARAAKGLSAPKINARLEELAGRFVTEVDDAMDAASLDDVGKSVLAELKKGAGAGGLSVLVSGQRVVAASEYQPTQAIATKPEIELGIGAASAKDDHGRPAIKVLVLVGA
jgi:uncharacterized protein YkwD